MSGTKYGSEGVLIDPRIFGGGETDRGQWPFIAALYHTNKSEYFCGGTLISSRHILTGKNDEIVVVQLNPLTRKRFQPPIVYKEKV